MAEKLFPTRKMCKTCGKKLNENVLEGLYCSYKCGNFAKPYTNIEDAPRYCKIPRDGSFVWKQRYRAAGEIPQRLHEDPATNIYVCSHCHFFHVGHSRATGKETARLVSSVAEVGSVLLRVREERNLTRQQVAQKLKTRPIRIKEIEEGQKGLDAQILFELIKFYRIKVNLLF